MSGRPRSIDQLANDKRKKNASNTLKARGFTKNLVNGKSLKAALAKHRLAEKNNDDFFAALTSSPANAYALVSGASVANTTAKKPRTTKEAAYNKRATEARAALEAQGLKKNSASVKRYLNGQLASGAAAAAVVKNEVILEEEELENNNGVLPSLVTAQVLAPAKGTLSHAEAGKKAAKSAKGSAWLDQIAAAKSNLNTSFAEVGLSKKATRANAMRLASTRRNNPGKARNIELNILSHAQGNAFNKVKKANKTARKSTKKRNNNSLNRATRNIANRMRNRLTRKKQAKYGTFNASRRIPRENLNNRFQGSPNNFNINELRNSV
jgi:hypothetical protein